MDSKLKELLTKKAKKLERKRKAVFLWAKFYKIVIAPLKAILRAGCFILGIACVIFPPILFYLIICGVAYILLEIINNPLLVYRDNLKKRILPDIYKELNPTVTYYSSAINREIIKESLLFNQSFFNSKIHIEGDDYINGTINNTEFIANDIEIFNEVVDYSKTIGGCLFSIVLFPIFIVRNLFADYAHEEELPFLGVIKKKVIIHKGLFIKASLPIRFFGKSILLPKKESDSKALTSTFAQEPIAVSDSFINTNYSIYSSNKNEINTVLTQKRIDLIKAIHTQEKSLPTVTAVNQELYLFIPRKTDLFKVNIYNKIKGISFFDSFLEDINYINTIISKIN